MSGSDAAYIRAWRKANPGWAEQQQRRRKIRTRALTLLADVYPADYAALLDAAEADLIEEGSA